MPEDATDGPLDLEFVGFSLDQLDDSAHLFQAAFAGPPWNEPYTLAAARERLLALHMLPNSVGLVARAPALGKLVGLALGQLIDADAGRSFRLNELCVHPDQHGQSLGSRLLHRLEQDVAGRGARDLVLMTSEAVATFYTKLGYGRTGGDEERWITLVRPL